MRTRVTELLGIDAPVIQGGGMARIADASLAAAVSEGGGLGVIAGGGASLEWMEQQVGMARSLTSKPIGVNIMLMDPQAAQLAKLVCELGVEVVTTGAGSPVEYLPMWKEAGIKVIPVVATTAQAKRMERLGVDAVVAEGTESGGHVGELTAMALVPSVCAAVSIPVIAAGGIADGRGICAAFALGAEGVQMGTRFLTVEECTVADEYKQFVLKAKDSDTMVIGRGSGHPVRCLKNPFSRQIRLTVEECTVADEYKQFVLKAKDSDTMVIGRGSGHPVRCLKNPFSRQIRLLETDLAANGAEIEAMHLGALRRAVGGDVANGTVMAGQVAALVAQRKSAAEVIAELVAEAEALGALDLDAVAALNARRQRMLSDDGAGED